MCRSHALLSAGKVAEAAADARSSLELALERGWHGMVPYVAAFLVEALIEQGELSEAERELGRPALAPWLGAAAGADKLLCARGGTRWAFGSHNGALEDLLACGERLLAEASMP